MRLCRLHHPPDHRNLVPRRTFDGMKPQTAADESTTPILESVVLPVRPGQETEFEEALANAVPIISRQMGLRDLRLTRCVE